MNRQPTRNNHHILHNRAEWELRPEALALRTSKPLIPNMDREVHNELHRQCPPVPLLGMFALSRTLRLYEPVQGDTFASMDNLLFAMEDAAKHPKSHPVESDLAYLAIHAIDLQRSYIKEGIE